MRVFANEKDENVVYARAKDDMLFLINISISCSNTTSTIDVYVDLMYCVEVDGTHV